MPNSIRLTPASRDSAQNRSCPALGVHLPAMGTQVPRGARSPQPQQGNENARRESRGAATGDPVQAPLRDLMVVQQIRQDKQKHTQLSKPPHVHAPPDRMHNPATMSKSGMDTAARGAHLELGPGSARADKAAGRAGKEEGVIRSWAAAATSHPWKQGGGNSPPLPSPPSWLELAGPLFSSDCCSLPQTSQGDLEKPLISQELREPGSADTTHSSQSEHHILMTQTRYEQCVTGSLRSKVNGVGRTFWSLFLRLLPGFSHKVSTDAWKHTKV